MELASHMLWIRSVSPRVHTMSWLGMALWAADKLQHVLLAAMCACMHEVNPCRIVKGMGLLLVGGFGVIVSSSIVNESNICFPN